MNTLLMILCVMMMIGAVGLALNGASRANVVAANSLLLPIVDMGRLNDQSLLFGQLPADGAGVRNGSIFAANDANFDAQFLNQPLTDYIVGAEDNQPLQELLSQMAPDVPVGRSFTYRTADTKEAFQTDSADDGDIRELGGDFKQVRRTGAQVDGRTDNKGLTMVLDDDEGGGLPAVQQRAVLNLTNRLLRSELRRVITLLDANDTAETSVNWGPTNTTADPDADILSMLENSGDERGVDSTTLVLGGAWLRRVLALRRSNTPGGYGTGALNLEQLAAYFNVDRVVLMRARFQSSSTAKTKILTNDVYAYHAQPGLMNDDASNIKRFVTPAGGGGGVQVYIERRLKKWLVSVEHYSRILCTSSVGIRKLPTTYT